MRETGVRAATSLLSLLARKETLDLPAWTQGRFLIPLVSQYTSDGAMHQFMQACAQTAHHHHVEVAFCAGFPLADTPDTGPSIVVYPAHTEALNSLSKQLDNLRSTFASDALDVDTAVGQLKAYQQGLTLLADVADNPGAGCAANDISLLCALHDKGIEHSLVATLNLPQWAADAHTVGIGQRFQQILPGRDEPIILQVLEVSEGRYFCTGPMWAGRVVDQGPTARLAWGTVELIVASRPVQALDLGALSCVGAHWQHYHVIALKSSVHFRAAFGPLAQRVINVDILRRMGQPEWVPPYRQLRAGVAPSPSHVQL
jgi:microcystin degradation protein MlrC